MNIFTSKKLPKPLRLISIFIFLCAFITCAELRAATFTVTNTDDSGAGSLRQAIADADSAAGDDVIAFDESVFFTQRTITLSGGELMIAGNGALTINGPGINLLTVSGNNQSRVLRVTGGTVTIKDLTMTNGRATLAAGIYADGSSGAINLTLERVAVINNTALGASGAGTGQSGSPASVGGIYINGTATLNNSNVSNNTAQGGQGVNGATPFPAGPGGSGGDAHTGGIYINGAVNINHSIIRANKAQGGAAGNGGNSMGNGTTGGAGGHAGSAIAGGINIQSSSVVNIKDSVLSDNMALAGASGRGGTSTGSNGTQRGGNGGNGAIGSGGAIYANASAVLNVTNSLLAGNTARASDGGNGGSAVPGGIPGTGGAGANSEGGAIRNVGTLAMTNTTVDSNGTRGGSQGLGFVNACGQSLGGGLYLSGTSSLTNVTVTRNTAFGEIIVCFVRGQGGGIFGTTSFGNTIVAANTGDASMPSNHDMSGAFNSLGYNLIESTTGAIITGTTTGNITGQSPNLGNLQYNGGATRTRAPNTGSPVINAGNNTLALNAGLTKDQRATCFKRIVGNAVEIGAFEIQTAASLVCNNFDYEGDGRTDLSVFRPASGDWYLSLSSNGSFLATHFGQQDDLLTPADFDGDGRADIAIFRNGYWYRLNSSDNQYVSVRWGIGGDIPVPGDYDGDGLADQAVFRQGFWYILQSRDGFRQQQFGLATDKPVVGDYDADGKNDLAVFRNGEWYIQQSRDGFRTAQFGSAGDRPLAADFDNDGKADLAVFRQGAWYLLQSLDGFRGVQFGLAADVPVAGDYDGDGKADLAVYRDGAWYLLQSTAGFTGQQFGLSGDVPTPSAFVP